MIIGNNFLKLYSPFCQYFDKISLKCPLGGGGGQRSEIIETKIINKFEVFRMHLYSLHSILEERRFILLSIEEKLLEVCSDDRS